MDGLLDDQLACWPASYTACRLASKLAMQESRLASRQDGWKASNKADKKSGLPSGWLDGWLTKKTMLENANLSHPPDLNGSIPFALCEGHLTANFILIGWHIFRVHCLA